MKNAVRTFKFSFFSLFFLVFCACPVKTTKTGSGGDIAKKSNGSGGGVGSGEGIGGATETREIVAYNFNASGPNLYQAHYYRYSLVKVTTTYPSGSAAPPVVTEEYYQVEGSPKLDTSSPIGGTRVNAPKNVQIGEVVATLSDSTDRTFSPPNRPGLTKNQYLLRVALVSATGVAAQYVKPGAAAAILYDAVDKTVALTLQASVLDTPIVIPPLAVTTINNADGTTTYRVHYVRPGTPIAGNFDYTISPNDLTHATLTYTSDIPGIDPITVQATQAVTLD